MNFRDDKLGKKEVNTNNVDLSPIVARVLFFFLHKGNTNAKVHFFPAVLFLLRVYSK